MASLAPDLDTLPVHEWPHFDGLVLAAVREGRRVGVDGGPQTRR